MRPERHGAVAALVVGAVTGLGVAPARLHRGRAVTRTTLQRRAAYTSAVLMLAAPAVQLGRDDAAAALVVALVDGLRFQSVTTRSDDARARGSGRRSSVHFVDGSLVAAMCAPRGRAFPICSIFQVILASGRSRHAVARAWARCQWRRRGSSCAAVYRGARVGILGSVYRPACRDSGSRPSLASVGVWAVVVELRVRLRLTVRTGPCE